MNRMTRSRSTPNSPAPGCAARRSGVTPLAPAARREDGAEQRAKKREQTVAHHVERCRLARSEDGGNRGVARLDLGRHGVEAEQAERRHEDRDGEEDVEPVAVEGAIAQQEMQPE